VLDRITLTRAARSETIPASLRITIRVKLRPVRVAFLAAAILLLGWSVANGFALMTIAPSSPGLGPGLLVFSGVGCVLLGRLVWTLFGREMLEITPLALSVRRLVGPLPVRRRTYRFAKLEGEHIIPRPGSAGLAPWKLLSLDTERASIVMQHRERYVRLTRDLDKAEGAYLLTAIRLWMQDR
jgi:hypothetical protein